MSLSLRQFINEQFFLPMRHLHPVFIPKMLCPLNRGFHLLPASLFAFPVYNFPTIFIPKEYKFRHTFLGNENKRNFEQTTPSLILKHSIDVLCCTHKPGFSCFLLHLFYSLFIEQLVLFNSWMKWCFFIFVNILLLLLSFILCKLKSQLNWRKLFVIILIILGIWYFQLGCHSVLIIFLFAVCLLFF